MNNMLSTYELNRIAVTAMADRRTVRKLVMGLPVQPMARARIEAALKELGLEHLIPADTRDPAAA